MLALLSHSSVQLAVALALPCAIAVADPDPPFHHASQSTASRSDDDEPTFDDLRRDLRDERPDKRRRTVTKLAELGTEDAKRLVLEALGDPSAEVADEAQLAIVDFEPIGVIDDLLGKEGMRSKDPLVRLRAAEAIGRVDGPVDAWAVARALDKRDEPALRAAMWSLEKLGRRRALSGDIDKLVDRIQPLVGRRANDRVRAAALQVLCAVAPVDARRTVETLRKVKDRETACSVLMALSELEMSGNQGTIEAAASAKDAGVRMKAVELLEKRSSRSTLGLLVERLRVEPRPAVREKIVATLQWVTGFRHRDDIESWQHTVNELPATWRSSDVKNAYRANRMSGGSLAAMRRLPPGSDRIAILVDFSGSLWNEKKDGMRRKDLLDPEVEHLLSRLNQNGSFFLVPFTGEPHPFSKRPIRASSLNVRKAQSFFRSATMNGKGNVYDAIQLALSFPEIDRIMVLTDGAPTGGQRWDVDLMVALLKEQIRFRPVTFDFVLLDAESRLEKRWRGLAEATGGRTVSLSL